MQWIACQMYCCPKKQTHTQIRANICNMSFIRLQIFSSITVTFAALILAANGYAPIRINRKTFGNSDDSWGSRYIMCLFSIGVGILFLGAASIL